MEIENRWECGCKWVWKNFLESRNILIFGYNDNISEKML